MGTNIQKLETPPTQEVSGAQITSLTPLIEIAEASKKRSPYNLYIAPVVPIGRLRQIRQERQDVELRADAMQQLTKYVFHKARCTKEDMDTQQGETLTRLLLSAKSILSPKTPADYLDSRISSYDLMTSEFGRDLVARAVNPTTIPDIAQTPEVVPFLEELHAFITDPQMLFPTPAAPMPLPRLHLVGS